MDDADVKGGVGDHIGNARPRRQYPELDAEMGRAIVAEPEQGADPAPDRPVVKLQMTHGLGPAVEDQGQQGRKLGMIFPEAAHQAFALIAGAEADPPRFAVPAAEVDGLLEQGNARLLPELPAEQERRIGGGGEGRAGNDERGVIVMMCQGGGDHEMDL